MVNPEDELVIKADAWELMPDAAKIELFTRRPLWEAYYLGPLLIYIRFSVTGNE